MEENGPLQDPTQVIKENTSGIKSASKFFGRFNSKRGIAFLVILIAIPLTIVLALTTQNYRPRASGGERPPMFLGMATNTSTLGPNKGDLSIISADVEDIKSKTGAYPAVYEMFIELGSPNQISLDVLNYLDSKGITPMISLSPLGYDMGNRRRDGRFSFSNDISTPSTSIPAGQVKFNSSNPASITKVWVSKTSNKTEDDGVLAKTWMPGETVSIFGAYNPNNKASETLAYNDTHLNFTIQNKIDKGTYWELNVSNGSLVSGANGYGVLFANNKPIFISMTPYYARKWGNQQIAQGDLDDRFTSLATKLKDFGKPVIVRYAWEMNGQWFPWSAAWTGWNDKLKPGWNDDPPPNPNRYSGFGRYSMFDMGNGGGNGEVKYVNAWRHIYSLLKGQNGVGATNVLFYWCGDRGTGGYEAYFPGDAYVDYVGFDAYSGIGAQAHANLPALASPAINKLTSLSAKKIIIGELGINSHTKSNDPQGLYNPPPFPTFRKNWLSDGYNYLYNYTYQGDPRIAGVIYFNLLAEKGPNYSNNWLLSNDFSNQANPDPVPEILSTYRTLLANPNFQGRVGGDTTPTVSPSPSPSPSTPETLTGDYDGNGSVDIGDYNLWKSEYLGHNDSGAPVTTKHSDGDGNNVIDMIDYNIWLNNKH